MKQITDSVRFDLVRVIAEGGMGIVYEARQHGTGGFDKRVAIKLIREEFSAIKEFRDNFVGEARLVADLIHTNIVQTYHLGEIDGQYYMTMEYVDGVTLDQFIRHHSDAGHSVPPDIAAFIISRICRGLAYAHKKRDREGRPLGIVHRDVNPRNIMIAHEGDVKLTDFGIAKALNLMYNKEGEVVAGKDEYLSPEAARREVTDARADLFSCAIVLTEVLMGENIFDADSEQSTRKNILEMAIPDFTELRPDVDYRLDDIIQQALKRDREKRFQSADEMLTALEVFLYSDGYGPTNEKLAEYLRDLLTNGPEAASSNWTARASGDSTTRPSP